MRSESVDLGSETANLVGEWTLVPYVTIPPGNHQFSAIATLPDGSQVESDQVLVVSVPEPDEDEGSVLALLMPRDGDGTSTVLQKPKPAPEKVEPEPAPEVADEERIELARPDTTLEDKAEPDAEQPDEARPEETPPAPEDTEVAGVDEAPVVEAQPAPEDTEVAGVDETPAGEAQPDEEPMDQASLTEDRSDDTGTPVAADAAGEATAGAPSDDGEAVSEASPSEEDTGSLVVDTVDYDDEGDMTIAGSAEPEVDLLVYLDERHVGTIESDAAGDWEVTPDNEVAPGTYTLRVDQVDPAGVVLARIETPLTRARPEELSFGDAIVVVQPGNSLWRIARRTLGGGIHFTEIYEANRSQIADPALIHPGQIFTVPELN